MKTKNALVLRVLNWSKISVLLKHPLAKKVPSGMVMNAKSVIMTVLSAQVNLLVRSVVTLSILSMVYASALGSTIKTLIKMSVYQKNQAVIGNGLQSLTTKQLEISEQAYVVAVINLANFVQMK